MPRIHSLDEPPKETKNLIQFRSWKLASNDESFSTKLAVELPTAFLQSGCMTLDEFVEASGNHKFLPLVKAGIIRVLLDRESDASLFPRPPLAPLPRERVQQGQVWETPRYVEADWQRYLFRHMRTADLNAFSQNEVKVITFNFDRSFERKLFLMLKSAYGVSDQVADRLAAAVPVLHLHGALGAEGWRGATGRDYGSSATQAQIQEIYRSIRIVHEEIDQGVLVEAREWLNRAETICFLGFSFHHTNTKRLRLHDGHPNASICGTALGLSGPEVARAEGRFKLRPALHNDKDCFRLLREVSGILATEVG